VTYLFAIGLSSVVFLYYGVRCIFGDSMAEEFERFGIPKFRKLTGILEVIGALGLSVGYFLPPLVVISSGGLALLMALGVAVRIRARDSFVAMLPAILLMLLNSYILLHSASRSVNSG
jgi:uncharacterized membrane protein YphA (DoxX/SURF4 family)